MPEQRPLLSCPPSQWLSESTHTNWTEHRAAPSTVVHANKLAGLAHADKLSRRQNSAFTCHASQNSGWLSPHRSNEQNPLQLPQMSCPPPQWLSEPTPIERSEGDQRPQLSCPPLQWLPVPSPTKQTEVKAVP